MSDKIKTPRFHQSHRSFKIRFQQPSQITLEFFFPEFPEIFRGGIRIYNLSCRSINQMYRTDPVIQRQMLKIVGSRMLLRIQIIDFHTDI